MKMNSRFNPLSWRTGVALFLVLALIGPSIAYSADPQCDLQFYYGITHCVHDEGNTHVLIINLKDQHIRFETALAAYVSEEDDKKFIECTDVNRPSWSPEGRGCPPGGGAEFPTQAALDHAARYADKNVVAVINADYMADNRTHGPEGLTIKNGVRYDGWRNGDCDGKKGFDYKNPTPCYGNDVHRSSLSISRNNEITIGRKSIENVDNIALYKTLFYNSVGGGPLIVEEGDPITDNAAACATEHDLPTDVCTRKHQTAVGVTQDGKTLVLVVSGVRDAVSVAKLMAEDPYKVHTAMKLDGGGSSQMWIRRGDLAFYYYISDDDDKPRHLPLLSVGDTVGESIPDEKDHPRPVSEVLLVFSDSKPLAFITNLPEFPIVDPQTETKIAFTMQNISGETWKAGDYSLVIIEGQHLSPSWQPGKSMDFDVHPGWRINWEIQVTAPANPGIYRIAWQFRYKDVPIGSPIWADLIVVPGGSSGEFKAIIQELVDQARQNATEKFEEEWAKIRRQIITQIWAEVLSRICPARAASILLPLLGATLLLRRRRSNGSEVSDGNK